MKKTIPLAVLTILLTISCKHTPVKSSEVQLPSFKEGEFGFDLQFLQKQDPTLVLLKQGDAQVAVSPRYQAKVFTSTARGDQGLSFGWINYKAFGKTDPHMNAYGGENRLWLGPEGGRFSLFFEPGKTMVFENWKTPSSFDTENWTLQSKDSRHVLMSKDMKILNYAGNTLSLRVDRTIRMLDNQQISALIGFFPDTAIHRVGYETENTLTNTGSQKWTSRTGMPCIWILDMFKPSAATAIVVPFQKTSDSDFSKVVTTNYFGEIPSDRIQHADSLLIFKADGKSRGKLGISSSKAKNILGSYDQENKVLTIILFNLDTRARYLNQEWNITRPTFAGDAANAYNDGPLKDGSQMGPFYEMESVSPAAFLLPGSSLVHQQAVLHFTGEEKLLNEITEKLLGISLEKINHSF